MLRHSLKLVLKRQKLVHIRMLSEGVDRNAKIEVEAKKSYEIFKERVANLSSNYYARYSEIIGWNEIDDAYRKVTALQVRSLTTTDC